MTEILDTYNANLDPIGPAGRDEVHAQGLWHRTFHCWILAQRDGRNYVLLQLRSQDKHSYPDCLDITAAGHLESGETPADGVRELNEELGLRATIDQLIYLGIKHDVADIGDHTKNREFADVYLLRDDRLLSEYLLQEEEVSGLVEVEVQDGLRLFSCEVDSAPAHATRLVDGAVINFELDIRRDDLIPRIDSYYYKIFIMADRYFSGSQYLAI